ncbi:MAG: T9SS type A sorting domain-containing protein [Bacteroidetes bacterium]|nr:T9SS type A sorting domain-containing protein [Bacteroidota bacterium]
MKKFLSIIALLAIISCNSSEVFSSNPDTLSMNPGYASDIFYSMSQGEVLNTPRAGWDMAFYTSAFSAGIIINEGSGVELYAYPNGDTSAWSSMDTTGLSSWTPLYNSPTDWEDGAFNRTSQGHPDYGWGVYNMITHSIVGDSLFVIKTEDGSFKKLWIVDKISVDNLYNIRFADLDGANQVDQSIDVKPFISKNFIYYSITNDELLDREPSESWDILFTKYIDLTTNSSGELVEYLVTGVTSNIGLHANKFTGVGPDFDDWISKPFDSLKNTIGYDWKSFDMQTFSWVVDDSIAFFVKDDNDDVYKLVFTYWQGSSTGVFAMNKSIVSSSSIQYDVISMNNLTIYPNPSVGYVNVKVANNDNFKGQVVLTDISGRMVYESEINGNHQINTSGFNTGMYFITVSNSQLKETSRLIVK